MEVIHFSGPVGDNVLNNDDVLIRTTTLDGFVRGGQIEVEVYNEREQELIGSAEEIVEVAKNHIGQKYFRGRKYNIINNNCEHFAHFCVYGKKKSEQVERVVKTVSVAAAGVVVAVAGALIIPKKNKNDKKEEK